jgi:uncharacterized protein
MIQGRSFLKILKDILNAIHEDAPVTEVIRGLHTTTVVSRFCGFASTVLENTCHDAQEKESMRSFTDMTALELGQLVLSEDSSKASIGLAAINSLIEVDEKACADIDGLQLVRDMGKDKNITVVGHFPFLETLSEVARNLWIIEKNPKPGDLPEEAAGRCIPQSDIVVITSTTLINHTFPGIFDLCRKGSIKMLLGPSTPMTPVLFDYGIDILSGSVAADRDLLFKHIKEGSSFFKVKKAGAIRFVTMVKEGVGT